MSRNSLERTLTEHLGEKVVGNQSVGGGCIAETRIVTLESGRKLFVKTYGGRPRMYTCEANGLREIASAMVIRTPEVILVTDQLLVLEHIQPSTRNADFMPDFGRRFAELHRHTTQNFGFREDNFIGTTPQLNTPALPCDWAHFFWEYRLLYQYRLVEQHGLARQELTDLFLKLEAAIGPLLGTVDEPPALLHGDLWSGNYMTGPDGYVCLIDPAVYYGHREADLAMTRLFGNFGDSFYDAYREAYPLASGWRRRLPVYQLYHMLNHLNLFGGGYYSQCVQLLRDCV